MIDWWVLNLVGMYRLRKRVVDWKYYGFGFAGSREQEELAWMDAEIDSCLAKVDISDIYEVFDRPIGL